MLNKRETKPIVAVSIKPGPASQARKATYRRFWAKLVSQVKDELDYATPELRERYGK